MSQKPTLPRQPGGDRPTDLQAFLGVTVDRVNSQGTQSAGRFQEFTVTAGQNAVPCTKGAAGRIIVYSTAGAITDVSISNGTWTFTAAAAGTIKVEFV